jgi:transposase
MPNPLELELSDKQRTELEQVRDHDPRPYLREHAAAILKVANGLSGRQTALHGLLRTRWPDTVYRWVERYQAEGLKGVEVKSGRGRKPSFSP